MRRLWYDLVDAEWLRDSLGLHGCQIAIRLDHFHRSTTTGEILFYERRYFVTSLDPSLVSTLDLMRLIRGIGRLKTLCISSRTAGGMRIGIGRSVRVGCGFRRLDQCRDFNLATPARRGTHSASQNRKNPMEPKPSTQIHGIPIK